MTDTGKLKKIFGPLDFTDPKIKCDFIRCIAGMGVAGPGYCFRGGVPERADCPRFKLGPDYRDSESTLEEKL